MDLIFSFSSPTMIDPQLVMSAFLLVDQSLGRRWRYVKAKATTTHNLSLHSTAKRVDGRDDGCGRGLAFICQQLHSLADPPFLSLFLLFVGRGSCWEMEGGDVFTGGQGRRRKQKANRQ